MASRILEDLLCGVLGYGIGRNQERQLTSEEYEAIIKHWLQNTDLQTVIDAWIADGEHGWDKSIIIFNLEQKIDEIKYTMDD